MEIKSYKRKRNIIATALYVLFWYFFAILLAFILMVATVDGCFVVCN